MVLFKSPSIARAAYRKLYGLGADEIMLVLMKSKLGATDINTWC
jgi:hypothetical protein